MFAVAEATTQELARVRRPKALTPVQQVEEGVDDRAAAMDMELGAVFARGGTGRGKPERQTAIEDLA
jgi:hypothetical protein